MTVAYVPPSYTETTAVVVASPQKSVSSDEDKVDSNIVPVLGATALKRVLDLRDHPSLWTQVPQSRKASFEERSASLFIGSVPPPRPEIVLSPTTPSNGRVGRILRAHFGKNILSEMVKLSEHAGTPDAASFTDAILRYIRLFRDQSPTEPFLEILMALHDAMAFENRWVDYSGEQYQLAAKILADYVNLELDNSKVEKAIQKLTKAGFDTLPFGVDFEDVSNVSNG